MAISNRGERDIRRSIPIRWSVRKMDTDKLIAALMVSSWAEREEEVPIEKEVNEFRDKISRSCDVAMLRSRPKARKATHWWSEEITDLRELSLRARRRWTRARRGRSRGREEEARARYREAKKTLYKAISKSKAEDWGDLLTELDKDPWSLAYKVVRNKLRRWSPPATESLDQGFLQEVVGTVIPMADNEEEENRCWTSEDREGEGEPH